MKFALATLLLLAASPTLAQRPRSVERGTAAFIEAVNKASGARGAATIPKVRPKTTSDLEIAHIPANVMRHWARVDLYRPKRIEAAKKQVAAAQREYTLATQGRVNPRYKQITRGPRNVFIFPSAAVKARTIDTTRTLRDTAQDQLRKAESGYSLPEFDSEQLPEQGQAGDLGTFTIRQVIDDSNLLVELHPRGRDVVFWIANIDTSGLADGRSTGFTGAFICTGTRRYSTVVGSTRTVLVVEPVDAAQVIGWQRNYENRE